MESLKKFTEICQKDARQTAFVIMDENGIGFREQTIEDFYKRAESISLHSGVPEKIKSHFETARNLIIYSWFYYPFNVTAQFCAYTSVEYALRTKNGGSSRISLSNLVKKAVAQKWIRDEGFPHVKLRRERAREYNEGLPKNLRLPESPIVDEYCKHLQKSIPFLRNELAHGSSMLHNHGAMTVRICANLINQLFEEPKTS